jgi:hypothetical protein
MAEGDMVYYNKDDLTNYSKGLGLNKVQAKNFRQGQGGLSGAHSQYPGSGREDMIGAGMGDSQGSLEESYTDSQGVRRRRRRRVQGGSDGSFDDNIDGRVKVDSWNLNFKDRKKK